MAQQSPADYARGTEAGLTAALWHNAWWIAAAFIAVLLLTLVAILVATRSVGGGRPAQPTR